ncbi:3-oxoacyl-ACP reductase [Gracilibacillus halophilus YIM-C55.5]|uniref:3-oxoacyl-ACP reductase n=1 Tax=Gracilibacillus halophilus YIM-C55.5 TaxID=1308866 RepID=N4WK48_9BACI|nr:SDR family oxidoreductase [Gracilibacillus halophilus]ENH96527.1 3-oxoacyl-ACP reductase [Gracilibacillus halophilus YIM-C55.5]
MSKKCLIVGASGDIGSAIAKQLADLDYQLILHYCHHFEAISDLKTLISDDAIYDVIQADLATKEGLTSFLLELPVDIDHIVFASGTSYFGLFQEMHDMDMDHILHLHLTSPWKITKHLLPHMIQRKFGAIILISSIWGEFGASCEVAYSSVKGGQDSFVKALAKEVGPSGIRVNGVSPGFIQTKMNRHLLDEEKNALHAEIPLQRSGTPDEVAHIVSFLLSEKSSYIQGEIVRVQGGWM